MSLPRKRYLGDGVYVEFNPDFGALRLTTEDGYSATNTIVLESEVWAALEEFVSAVKAAAR